MDTFKDDNQVQERKKERELAWQKTRKTLIIKILMTKRMDGDYKKDISDKKEKSLENLEVQMEGVMKEDHQSLSKYKHKRKKLSKKRWWICKSPFHFKKSCPKIWCYYCRRMGHIASNCRDKKIDFIYERLIEDLKTRNFAILDNAKTANLAF